MKTGTKILIGVGILSLITIGTIFIVRRSNKKKQEKINEQTEPFNLDNITNTDLSNAGVNTVTVKPNTQAQTNAGSSLGTMFGSAKPNPTTTTTSPMKAGDKILIKSDSEYIYSKPVGTVINRLGTIGNDAKAIFVASDKSNGFSEITVKKYTKSWGFPHYSDSVAGDRVFIPTERIKKA